MDKAAFERANEIVDKLKLIQRALRDKDPKSGYEFEIHYAGGEIKTKLNRHIDKVFFEHLSNSITEHLIAQEIILKKELESL